jgi:nitroreductase
MSSPVLDFLLARTSPPLQALAEPGPGDAQIGMILKAASRVPDHGRLVPWRFIVYRGEARHRIGEALVALAVETQGPLADNQKDKERKRFAWAPVVIGVVHCPREHPKIPKWEMFLSGGAAATNLMLAATALGFGAVWLTGWYADLPEGRRLLGLEPDERIIGFIHIGTPTTAGPDRPRPDLASIVSEYSGPAAA